MNKYNTTPDNILKTLNKYGVDIILHKFSIIFIYLLCELK